MENNSNRINFKVGVAEEKNTPHLAKLIHEILTEMSQYYKDEAIKTELRVYTADYIQKLINNPDFLLFKAEVNKNIVGFQIVSIYQTLAYLEWSGVHPDYRRQGIGRALKSLTEEYLLKNRPDVHKIWCDTRVTNTPSIKNLLKNGYQISALLRKHWFGEDYYLYEKIIRP